jgi:hypothetical protein
VIGVELPDRLGRHTSMTRGAGLARLAILTVVLVACSRSGETTAPSVTTNSGPRPSPTSPPAPATVPPSSAMTLPDGPPGVRTVEIPQARLGTREALGFAYHPGAEPARIESATPGLEVCPASTDGVIDLTGGSWPTSAGFDTCRALDEDGRGQIPSPGITFHVGFAVRAVDTAQAISVSDLAITYDAVDGFFAVFPPSDGVVVTVVPSFGRVAVQDLAGGRGDAGGTSAPARVDVRQGGRVLSMEETPAGDRAAAATPGQPVTIELPSHRRAEAGTGFVIDWR